MSANAPSGDRRVDATGETAPARRPAGPNNGHSHAESRFNSSSFDAEGAPVPDRLLSCMAGFYDNEAQARQALLHLRQAEGLLPSQSMLLSPQDDGRLRFMRLARRWALDRDDDSARPVAKAWAAAIGGVLLAIGAVSLLLWRMTGESDTWLALMLLAALGLGGLLGAGLLGLFVRPARPHRFDVKVRTQLGQGCWALVAHRVPWARQAGVVKLLRSTSQGWCAEAPHIRRL